MDAPPPDSDDGAEDRDGCSKPKRLHDREVSAHFRALLLARERAAHAAQADAEGASAYKLDQQVRRSYGIAHGLTDGQVRRFLSGED